MACANASCIRRVVLNWSGFGICDFLVHKIVEAREKSKKIANNLLFTDKHRGLQYRRKYMLSLRKRLLYNISAWAIASFACLQFRSYRRAEKFVDMKPRLVYLVPGFVNWIARVYTYHWVWLEIEAGPPESRTWRSDVTNRDEYFPNTFVRFVIYLLLTLISTDYLQLRFYSP